MRLAQWAKSGEGGGALAHASSTEHPTFSHRLTNPLCGDECTLHLQLEQLESSTITAAAQETRGCVLCHAAAAQLILLTRDTPLLADMATLSQNFINALKNATPLPPSLEMFTPVTERKSRHNCILLPYQALLEIAAEVKK